MIDMWDVREADAAMLFITTMDVKTENASNIRYFQQILDKHAETFCKFIFRLENQNGAVVYANLASLCIIRHKLVFFNMVLDACPFLMISQGFASSGQPVITPLSSAVLICDLVATQTVLSHQTLSVYAASRPEQHINVINKSLALAKNSFKGSSHEEAEIIRQLEEAASRKK